MTLVDAKGAAVAPAAPKVLIAIPSGDSVKAGFANDLAHLMGTTLGSPVEISIRLTFNKGTLLPSQRTGLVYEAIQHGCTHILWLDSDMRFPPWTLLHLLQHEKPIVAANYVTRRAPIRPVTMKTMGDDRTNADAERCYTTPESSGLEAVAGIGMGCVLMEVEVFHYVPQPWFLLEWRELTTAAGIASGYVSEDLYFCDKLRTAQIPVLVDHDLSKHIRHEGSWDYSHDHALVQRDAVHAESPARDLRLDDPPSRS